MRLYLETFVSADNADFIERPRFVEFELTDEKLVKMREMAAFVQSLGASEIRFFDYSIDWCAGFGFEGEPFVPPSEDLMLRTSCDELVVTREDFYFTAQDHYGPWDYITARVSLAKPEEMAKEPWRAQ